jgi:hypothetical protein
MVVPKFADSATSEPYNRGGDGASCFLLLPDVKGFARVYGYPTVNVTQSNIQAKFHRDHFVSGQDGQMSMLL